MKISFEIAKNNFTLWAYSFLSNKFRENFIHNHKNILYHDHSFTGMNQSNIERFAEMIDNPLEKFWSSSEPQSQGSFDLYRAEQNTKLRF